MEGTIAWPVHSHPRMNGILPERSDFLKLFRFKTYATGIHGSARWERLTSRFGVSHPPARLCLSRARVQREFGAEPVISFGGIGPLVESFINFSRFQQ